LTTLYLLKQGYDITHSFALESYYNRERTAYYDALHRADVAVTGEAERDVTAWLEYFTTGMLTEAARAESRIREELARRGPASLRLSETQQTIVRIIQEKGAAKMVDFAAVLPISERGIRKAAQRLVELGVLEQVGSKRGAYYRLATPQSPAR
jgi:Fic family protein